MQTNLYNLRKISKHICQYVDHYSTPTIEINNMAEYYGIPFDKCKLVIYNSKNFSDKNMNALANNLTSLDLWKNNKITDTGLSTLVNLTSLNLFHNNTITDECINNLKNKNVKILK